MITELTQSLPPCDHETAEPWRNGMVLCDALQFPNTWFVREGDQWLGDVDGLLTELGVPREWVEWRDSDSALLRIQNEQVALVYVWDSRYEFFALARKTEKQHYDN